MSHLLIAMMNVFMLSVVMLNVFILNVVAPKQIVTQNRQLLYNIMLYNFEWLIIEQACVNILSFLLGGLLVVP
jgi:hypothetical protein